jgi:hypothetical protein
MYDPGTNGEDNDGTWPDGTPVLTCYPITDAEAEGDRASWPWLPAVVLSQRGPDEWTLVVEAHAAARVEDGTGICLHPVVSRAAGEIRPANPTVEEMRAIFVPGYGGTR